MLSPQSNIVQAPQMSVTGGSIPQMGSTLTPQMMGGSTVIPPSMSNPSFMTSPMGGSAMTSPMGGSAMISPMGGNSMMPSMGGSTMMSPPMNQNFMTSTQPSGFSLASPQAPSENLLTPQNVTPTAQKTQSTVGRLKTKYLWVVVIF